MPSRIDNLLLTSSSNPLAHVSKWKTTWWAIFYDSKTPHARLFWGINTFIGGDIMAVLQFLLCYSVNFYSGIYTSKTLVWGVLLVQGEHDWLSLEEYCNAYWVPSYLTTDNREMIINFATYIKIHNICKRCVWLLIIAYSHFGITSLKILCNIASLII